MRPPCAEYFELKCRWVGSGHDQYAIWHQVVRQSLKSCPGISEMLEHVPHGNYIVPAHAGQRARHIGFIHSPNTDDILKEIAAAFIHFYRVDLEAGLFGDKGKGAKRGADFEKPSLPDEGLDNVQLEALFARPL